MSVDLDKIRKNVTSKIPGIAVGFSDPVYWIDTGNHALNYIISGDYYKGIPYGKITMFAGESGTGKSLLCSGSITKQAQDDGALVALLDSENALDEEWLQRFDIDTSENKIIKMGVSMIDDVAKLLYEFIESYKKDNENLPLEDQPKMLFVIDSLGMLLSPTDQDQFEKGDMKGDMGRKAKQLKSLVQNLVNRIAHTNIAIVCTNHTYASQDIFDPEDKVSGGRGIMFASSIVIALKKGKLKSSEDAPKGKTNIAGIIAKCKALKTRHTKPFQQTDLEIPYNTGLDPYAGLFDFFKNKGIIESRGPRFVYYDSNGDEYVEYRKNWTNQMLDMVMNEESKKKNMTKDDTHDNEDNDANVEADAE